MAEHKTVITGIGVVSPIGIGIQNYWQALFEAKSGFVPISLFDTKGLDVAVAGEITGFNPHEILGEKQLRDFDRATLLVLCASHLALKDADREITEAMRPRTGVAVGTTFGSLYSLSLFDRESLTEGPTYVNPSIFPNTVGNSPASRISIRFQIKGFNTSVATGMCSGLDALDYSRTMLAAGRADTILCGSVEDLAVQTFLGFYMLRYLSGQRKPHSPLSCPFDKRRDGIIVSEGSSVFILEDKDRVADKTKIYGSVLGIGSAFDPSRHYNYSPAGAGMIAAMTAALDDARLAPEDIDCIFANANSTQDADLIESRAIRQVFGTHARSLAVTSIKGALGESYSASGGLSVAAALGALRKGAVPPIANLAEPDERCDLDLVVKSPRQKKLRAVMVNAFGPNGSNTSVILGN